MRAEDTRHLLAAYREGQEPFASDQRKGKPQPPLEKPFPEDAAPIALPSPSEAPVVQADVTACIRDRVSHRAWNDAPVSLAQLAYLLWATQGVKEVGGDGYYTRRTVPSAGARHPFETYLAVSAVSGLEPGVYRYLALSHRLLPLSPAAGPASPGGPAADALASACCGQRFCATAPVLFVWSAHPYRMEWRYGPFAAKAILLDAGHVCQNLYLACEALGLGTCAIAAYVQEEIDRFFGLDGRDELAVYLAPVGRPA